MPNVLLTGASGFLGNYIKKELVKSAKVLTLGRDTSNDIVCDLVSNIPLLSPVSHVIHAAGKAHIVPKNKKESLDFFRVNVQGTENLLKGIDKLEKLPEHLVFISSVSVYGLDTGENISESEPLLGGSPYAESKVEAENRIRNWGKKRGVPVLILRLPLLVGAENPKGNLQTLLKGIQSGYYFRPGRGDAKKSMVLAEDVAKLIARLDKSQGTYNLTDGYHPTFAELDSNIAKSLGKKIKVIPEQLLSSVAKVGDLLPFFPLNSLKFKKMTASLTFSDQLARQFLAWSPSRVIDALDRDFGKRKVQEIFKD